MVNLHNPTTLITYPNDGKVITEVYKDLRTPLGLTLQLGFGYVIPLNQKMRMTIQPRLQYFLNSNTNIALQEKDRLYNIGLQTSLTF